MAMMASSWPPAGADLADCRQVRSAAESLGLASAASHCHVRRASTNILSAGLRVAVVCVGDEVTRSMLTANHALGCEFHQDEPDCRTAGIQLLRELSFGWQAPSWPKLARRDQVPDRALNALCFGAHTAPRRPWSWRVSLRLTRHRGEAAPIERGIALIGLDRRGHAAAPRRTRARPPGASAGHP